MDKESKIYVAGHRGLVGSAIWNNLKSKGYTNLVGRTHSELDLLDGVAVREFFDSERPEYVVLAAAHVGGIVANNTYRADFIYRNLQIQQNVIGETSGTGEEAVVPGQHLYLPPGGPPADAGGLPVDRPAGIHERALRHGENCRFEDVREF